MASDITFWDAMNFVARLAIVVIAVVKVWRFYDSYNRAERLGLGVLAGCALMTIPVVLQGAGSPFAEWASAFFAVGVLIYLAGRLYRTIEHDRANRAQVRQATKRKVGGDGIGST